MADLADAIRDTIEIRGLDTMTLPGLMAGLRQLSGTVTGAARAAGIDRRTWQRWETGKIQSPTAGKIGQVRDALRRGLAAQRRPALVARHGHLKVKGTVSVSGDSRIRTLDLGPHFTTSTRAAIIDAADAGDYELAAEKFEDPGLAEDYGAPGMYFSDVTSLDWR